MLANTSGSTGVYLPNDHEAPRPVPRGCASARISSSATRVGWSVEAYSEAAKVSEEAVPHLPIAV